MRRAFAQSLASEDAAVLQLSGFGAQLLALQISPQGLGLSHGMPESGPDQPDILILGL